jgi:dTDP-4-amino-4,6-dideoxygalactose transaminase
LYGMPAKMDEIMTIAHRFEIPVIEDAAEALGSSYKGKPMGTFGKLGVLSFNGNKIITTSGGGALISDDTELINNARHLSTQARDDAPYYQHSKIGYNYRLSNICAAIGLGQMEMIDLRIKQRRANYFYYVSKLANAKGLSFQAEPDNDYCSNRWITTILVDPKSTGGYTNNDIRLTLEKENIESRLLWKPMHLQPIFSQCPYYGNRISEKLFEKGLCLPSGSSLTDTEKDDIIDVMKKSFGQFH